MTARALKGRVAPITGGAAGIGRATAEALAAAGADVGIVDLDQARASAAIEATTAAHGTEGSHAMADVADAAATAAAHAAITDALGPVMVLVNNAGSWRRRCGRSTSSRSSFLTACSRSISAARPCSARCASVLGLVGLPFRLGYGVAKAAIIGLIRSLAMENARFGITETRSHRATSRPTPTSSGRPRSARLRPLRRAHAGRPLGSPGGGRPGRLPRRSRVRLHHRRRVPDRRRLQRPRRPRRRPRPAACVSHRKAPDEGGPGLWLLAENGLDVARAMEHAHIFNRVVDDAIEDDVALNREAA